MLYVSSKLITSCWTVFILLNLFLSLKFYSLRALSAQPSFTPRHFITHYKKSLCCKNPNLINVDLFLLY